VITSSTNERGATDPIDKQCKGNHARSGSPIPRPQQSRDQISRVRIEDQQGMVDMLSAKSVIKAQRLLPMSGIVGAVHVQRSLFRLALFLTLQVRVSKPFPGPKQIFATHRVFQSGQGRLAGQVGIAFGQPVAHGLENRIPTQRVRIVAIFIAGHDLKTPLGRHLRDLMANVAPIPNVSDTGCEILRQTLLLIQRPHTDQTGIGGQPASIESSHHFSVRVRWQVDRAD